MVISRLRHMFWSPARQGGHAMQLPAFQPKPTVCPRLTSLALRPRADTVPMASCPGTKGNCVICHSMLSMERSEWQMPQYCTSISTCSSPSGDILARVDVAALVERVDIDEILSRVDVGALLDRVDVNALAGRLDVGMLVEQTDLGAVIARSSGGVASEALDAVRSQAVGLDRFIDRWAWRLRRGGPRPSAPALMRLPAEP